MTIPDEIRADTMSHAWVQALSAVGDLPGRHAFHLIVRMERPQVELPVIRRMADKLLADLRLDPVTTVANTLFPAALARLHPEPAALTERYRRLYPRLRRFPSNTAGTYFGRLVALPTEEGTVDQLTGIVDKLRRSATGRRWKATYEADFASTSMAVYRDAKDRRKTMGFPCLSFCSFQLDGDQIHLVAHYRSQYLVQRAYGNYLALGQLLNYVARAAGLRTGQLTVIAGHASIERSVAKTTRVVADALETLQNTHPPGDRA
jgi:hypothetical protein